jgi:hypothetical protein
VPVATFFEEKEKKENQAYTKITNSRFLSRKTFFLVIMAALGDARAKTEAEARARPPPHGIPLVNRGRNRVLRATSPHLHREARATQ